MRRFGKLPDTILGRPGGMRGAPGRTLGGVQEHPRAGKIWPGALSMETRAGQELGKSLTMESGTPTPASRGRRIASRIPPGRLGRSAR